MKTNPSVLLTLAFFALLHPLLVLAQQTQTDPQQLRWEGPGPWHMWSGGWGFWWIFPMIMLFMIIVCVAMFFIGHRSGGGAHHHWGPGRSWGDPTYSALQILNERFAKGEIQMQEYEEKRAAIASSGRH
jgi:putative membrane protein